MIHKHSDDLFIQGARCRRHLALLKRRRRPPRRRARAREKEGTRTDPMVIMETGMADRLRVPGRALVLHELLRLDLLKRNFRARLAVASCADRSLTLWTASRV